MCNGAQDFSIESCCGRGECKDGEKWIEQNTDENTKHAQQTDRNRSVTISPQHTDAQKTIFPSVIVYTRFKFQLTEECLGEKTMGCYIEIISRRALFIHFVYCFGCNEVFFLTEWIPFGLQ